MKQKRMIPALLFSVTVATSAFGTPWKNIATSILHSVKPITYHIAHLSSAQKAAIGGGAVGTVWLIKHGSDNSTSPVFAEESEKNLTNNDVEEIKTEGSIPDMDSPSKKFLLKPTLSFDDVHNFYATHQPSDEEMISTFKLLYTTSRFANEGIRSGNFRSYIGRTLLDKIAHISPDQAGELLFDATMHGDYELAKKMFAKWPNTNVNWTDSTGTSPISNAAWAGHYDTMEELVHRGANVNVHDNTTVGVGGSGRTPLIDTSRNATYQDPEKGIATMKLLFANGANVDGVNKYGDNALMGGIIVFLKHRNKADHYVINPAEQHVIITLLNANIDLNHKNKEGKTIFDYARTAGLEVEIKLNKIISETPEQRMRREWKCRREEARSKAEAASKRTSQYSN